VKQALEILGMNHDSFCCAYCGDTASEWDHLRPLVKNKQPTGYISEIHNLVPACGKCNQSKGNKPWAEWMLSNAKLSPKNRGISDIELRIKRLQEYEQWEQPTVVDFEQIVGSELWQQHWENCEKVQSMMREAQVTADAIRSQIVKKPSQEGVMSDDLIRKLNSVGKRAFVENYLLFQSYATGKVSKEEAIDQLVKLGVSNESGASIRLSNAKAIFANSHSKDALVIIVESTNLPSGIIKKTKILLEESSD